MAKRDNLHSRRRYLDEVLPDLSERLVPVPNKGWIADIRSVLGMRYRQLARRLGVTPQTLAGYEKFEALGKINLDTLKRVAEALNCELYYAFIPKTTLEDQLFDRALEIIDSEQERIDTTMKLEDQGVKSDIRRDIKASMLVEKFDGRIWEDE